MGDLTREDVLAEWVRVAERLDLRRKVEAAHDDGEPCVLVDWVDLDKAGELGGLLLERPGLVLEGAGALAEDLLPPDAERGVALRVFNLPENARVPIRLLRDEHVGTLVALEGLIRKVNETRPQLREAVFECQMCGALTRVRQETSTLREPMECSKNGDAGDVESFVGEPGCLRPFTKTRFNLLVQASDRVDAQKLELQEPPELLKGGAQPAKIVGRMVKDLAGAHLPGDRVIVNGTLRCFKKENTRNAPTTLDWYIDVHSIEVKEFAYEDLHISPKDEEEIRALAANPNIHSIAARSIAPTIYSMDVEKRALLFQLFAGAEKILPDGTRLRGDVHVLMVGDPGTAKSQLLRYMSRLAPRGVYVSGKGASAAGLTAAAVRDDSFGEGKWTIEAGALVLADLGQACVDELDKMSPGDRDGLHEAMEQQTIHIAKAGITASLNTRCSVTAAANPKLGRFDSFSDYVSQLNLPPALLSRFDLILCIEDNPDEKRDRAMGTHILNAHRAGAVARTEAANPALEGITPPIAPELLRRFVALAKRTVFPVLTPEADALILDYYISRRKAGGPDRVAITARYLEALIRLTEASARLRLDSVATVEDARRAVELMDHSLRTATDADGLLDIDIIETGQPKARRDRARAVEEFLKDQAEPVITPVVVDALGIDEREVEDILSRLRDIGQVYNPTIGRWSHVDRR